jgi:cytoskeletal protein RodZ
MDFKLVSKNNVGAVLALLLVVLLSQSKIFNFLLDTALGRSILVFFVLILSYIHKILGVVIVLFIIILFNQNNSGYFEGFTDASGNTVTPNANQEARIEERKQVRQNVKANLASKAAAASASTTTSTTTPATTTTSNSPATTTTTSTTPATTTGGTEGFDLIGTENNIKRGKQSNKISVSSHMRESMNVSAFDGSFTDNYSAF